ncbi:MAG: hypothetical protein MUO62_17895 [Anaerolineales bacterium]|nr:hypothetical protein [Anaerolineales bacterium]
MKKVIYTNFTSPYWVDVAKQLASQSEWQPVYWLARPAQETVVKAEFPEVIFHSVQDAMKGIPSADYAPNTFVPIDTQVSKQLSECQLTTLKMMDRIDALGSFGYHDRTRLYYKLLSYWQTVVDDLSPNLVVFSTIPHMVYDYLLYELCKQRGIRTLMFESTSMMGLTFLMDDYDKPSRAEILYKSLLEENKVLTLELSPSTDAYLNSLKGSYDDIPAYARRAYKEKLPKIQHSTSGKNLWEKLLDFQKYPSYIAKQKRIILSRLRSPENYLKQRDKKLEESSLSRLDYELIRFQSARKMRKLEAHYHTLAGRVDFTQPYIYTAFSFQPERTSSPMGTIYVNQFLMVDLLAKSLPDGWRLYVKEHPTQFTASKYFRSQSGRTKDFYDDLAALPKVTIVSMTADSFDLIDNAKAVATLTGTVGWEALHRGKPTLTFGYPWYRGCEGTFSISTWKSCIDAVRKIEAGYEVDQGKLRLFVYAVQQTGLKAYVESHLKISNISDDENAELLAKALKEF